MEYVLETNNLSKKYGEKIVLNNINIKVPKGSIYGLVGKNGAGKTTLMRIICDLAKQTEGEFRLFNEKNTEKAHEKIGTLIENAGICTYLSAEENLNYHAKLYGVSCKNNKNLLKLVGLENAGSKKARTFSLGMKQRLGIAISLIGNPELLILDEPINGLDPEGVYEIRKLLKDLNQNHNITIIIASHILSELHKLATDYAIIDSGQLKAEFNKEGLEKQCQNSIDITVEKDQVQQAIEIIKSSYPEIKLSLSGKSTIKLLEKIDIPKINKDLVNKNINVYGLSINEENMEKFFVEKISGGKSYE